MGLSVTMESPLVITDFLDVKLNLNDISFMPYKKQNAKIMYVNKQSSHPKNNIKQIPNIINQHLKKSSKEEHFLKIKDEYETIIKKCGYNNKLKFENPEQNLKLIKNIKEKEM